MRFEARSSDAQTVGLAALDSYARVLAFLAKSGDSRRPPPPSPAALPFLQSVPGIGNLLLSLSAVAPATPGASDEEWNPLSQRPHTPLPPAVTGELGAEITALKEAVDAFTTLSHEMMHVALWEPFFTGLWRPRSRRRFREFSLMAEGYCFFFSDIIVSGAVRTRLPDGEFALDRQTPSNARFHPARAFQALGIQDHQAVLDIYLDGFSGQRTALWQPRGTNNYTAALAAQVYGFYTGTLRYLDELHAALAAFGGLSAFYRRFCAIPGLPTFLGPAHARRAADADLKPYFAEFFRSGLANLGGLTSTQVASVRWRRMLQMRAYHATQVRWLLHEGLVAARAWPAPRRRQLVAAVDAYLDGLHALLLQLARQADASPLSALKQLDARYDAQVRARFLADDAWVGHRWLIAPRRAGGRISLFDTPPAGPRAAKVALLKTVAFLVDELTRRMRDDQTVAARTAILAQIQRIAGLGAAGGGGDTKRTKAAARKLRTELARPELLEIWSVPLASFDPVGNRYRELVFSYQ